jgi:uncharacterized protein (DUF2141 family)
MKQIGILMLAAITIAPLSAKSETIEVSIKGIRNYKGTVRIGIFKNNDSFEKETPFKTFEMTKKGLLNGTLKCKIDLPEGTYGFAVLDDENDNEEMDTNFIGIPKEGFGFSNYEHSGIFAPIFNDFKFFVKKGIINRVKMKMKYM